MRTIQTAVPATTIDQAAVRDLFAAQPGLGRLGQRLVTASFDASGIDTRHTVVAEFDRASPPEHPLFIDSATGAFLAPSTRVRNEVYIEQAPELAVEAAAKALAALDLDPAAVTHVITASCTGFFAPGPDYVLVRRLGLDPAVQRFHVGFMGCYAAFPALRMAKAFCDADPAAVVLLVCVELCTLHMRSSNEADQIVASSVFADGAASAIVTADGSTIGRSTDAAGPALGLDAFATALTPVGEDDMAWTIGDQGFEMVLSSYVPKIIDDHITGALAPLLEPAGLEVAGVQHWAVHPGGRSILDRVEGKLGLSERQLAPSRATLREVGNISSATILFVLKRLLEGTGDGAPAEGERVCAMAFGPGLTVETGLFTVHREAA